MVYEIVRAQADLSSKEVVGQFDENHPSGVKARIYLAVFAARDPARPGPEGAPATRHSARALSTAVSNLIPHLYAFPYSVKR
jgi:hypothetical protein